MTPVARENEPDLRFTQDRELSWLKFNARVLEEAQDPSVPLWERLKFAAIFTGNLDEFFMVRVGRLKDLSLLKPPPTDDKSGLTPQQRLEKICKAVRSLCRQRDKVFAALEAQLRALRICRLSPEALSGKERRQAERWFREEAEPILSPMVIDSRHPFPHLSNKQLWIVLALRREGRESLGLLPVPAALPPFLLLEGAGPRYVLTEDLLLAHAASLFDRYTVSAQAVAAVTRSADLPLEEELEEDFRAQMKKALKQRARLSPVRLEVQGELPEETLELLRKRLDLPRRQVFFPRAPLSLSYVYGLERQIGQAWPALLFPPFVPRWPASLSQEKPLTDQLLRRDVLLYYPYHSMEPFLRLIREAAFDPATVSIKITVYRLSAQAKLMEYLAAAAENGKEVTVLLELRARFDEQNNIRWAERLEEAGCTLLYGLENYKVHAKLCLITRRERGTWQTITQIGTGNYNEKTARQYSDLSLLTSHPGIGADAALFFQALSTGERKDDYRLLLPAPSHLRPTFLSLIDREIAKGEEGFLFFKCNALTDRSVLDKLAQASRAGVRVLLNIRGVCCLLPGLPELTEHIQVFSLVGRFLEHARIYVFGKEDDAPIYLSSADLMSRNLRRRVELACPVLDQDLRRQVARYVELLCHDNVKSRTLTPEGNWVPVQRGLRDQALDAQGTLLAEPEWRV